MVTHPNISDETLCGMSRAQLRELMPLSPAQIGMLQRHVREALRRCGSLQTPDGLPCRRHPRFGWTVCQAHGERAPQTTAKAERLLAVARMPAIEWIMTALDQASADTCDGCGFPKGTLKELKRIDILSFRLLDRTGFGPSSKVDLNVGSRDTSDGLVENMIDSERAELRQLLGQINDLKARVRARLQAGTSEPAIDAQVVTVKALEPGQGES